MSGLQKCKSFTLFYLLQRAHEPEAAQIAQSEAVNRAQRRTSGGGKERTENMALFKRKDLEAQGLNEGQISWLMTEAQRALGDGYILKSTAQELAEEAARKAREEAPQAVNVTESEEYKALAGELAKTKAFTSEDFAQVKPKFRDQVWGLLDHEKPVAEQIPEIAKQYEEYFTTPAAPPNPEPAKPQFGSPDKGGMPRGTGGKSLDDLWGFGKR